MARFDFQPAAASLLATQLAPAILAAPAWCRVGITAPNERTREAAAVELAQLIVQQIDGTTPPDRRQLTLPF